MHNKRRSYWAQMKDHGRVPRWFGLGAKAKELFDTFSKINESGGQPGEAPGDAESKNFNLDAGFYRHDGKKANHLNETLGQHTGATIRLTALPLR
jgi:hypothetical protein